MITKIDKYEKDERKSSVERGMTLRKCNDEYFVNISVFSFTDFAKKCNVFPIDSVFEVQLFQEVVGDCVGSVVKIVFCQYFHQQLHTPLTFNSSHIFLFDINNK
jgi:hypothetical protein